MVLVLVATVGAIVVLGGTGAGSASRAGRVLGWLAVLAAVAGAAAASWVRDEGASVAVVAILGAPVAATLVAAAAGRPGPGASLVRWACALALVAYAALLALGSGLFFAPAALLLFASAVLRTGAGAGARARR